MTPQAPPASRTDAPPLAPPTEDRLTSPLLPPRPNLGPEPWPGPDRADSFLIASTLLVVTLAIAVGVLVIRRRRKHRGLPAVFTTADASDGSGSSQTGDDQRVAQAEAIRNALIDAFGPSWGAKTTEEIADEPGLVARIGPDRTTQLLQLLAVADRAKFAGSSAQTSQVDDAAEAVLADLIKALATSQSESTLNSH